MSLFSFNIKKRILFLSLFGIFAINEVTQAQNALGFNGSSSYVEIPYTATNNPAQFTVEFWARVDSGAGTFRSPLSNRNYPPVTGFNFYATPANIWSFSGGSGTGAWSELNGPAVVIGQWTHLAGTYDGTTYRFYVNGVLMNTLVAGFSVNTSRPLRIGAGRTEGEPLYYFPGAVDEVKIWNYARSASQINDNKNVNLALPQTGLMSYYQFEDGTATSKTGSNTGALINAPTTVTGVSHTLAPFITTWQTDGSNNITIPLTGSGYDFTIDWGDGTTEIKTGTPGNISHTYTSSGIKTVSITPNVLTGFPRIYVNNYANRLLLKTIESWGSGIWGAAVDRSFFGASNLEINATDIPDFSITTNFQYMFLYCTSVTGANGFTNWTLNTNPTATVSFSNMFNGATQFNGAISNWDVSRVNTFDNMFSNAQKFNQNIGTWNVANVVSMASMFNNAVVFAQDISGWNVGNVTNMSSMFQNADAFNIDISGWVVSKVTNMASMFAYSNIFNQDLSNWDVSSVTDMSYMFQSASVFNSPLNWGIKTGNVTNMQRMFAEAPQFNQDIDSWDVSNVTSTNLMFYRTNSFNQSLNSWNVGSLINPSQMFQECTSFNGNVSSWVFTTNPAKNVNATSMFQNATAFNQNISNWNTERFTTMANMFLNATSFNQNIGTWNVANVVSMASMFNNARVFAQDISGWNVANVEIMSSMFQNADAFNIDISGWVVSKVYNMASMFAYSNIFNQDLSNWDVSSVTNMSYMFQSASVFNSPLNWGIKTGNVTNMQRMFAEAPQFNQDIDSWDVSNVTSTNLMFYRTNSFNQSLNSWNVGSLINPSQMFQECTSFNGNVSSWVFTTNPAKNVNATSMFQNTTAFNQNISNWNTERFTTMANMFLNATSFNQNIGTWNVGNVTNMNSMFSNAVVFAQDISGWNVGNVTNMSSMFQNADAFNIDISGWVVSKVTNMASMFAYSNIFNQDLSNWDVSSVTNMSSMFRQMPLFNQLLNWGNKTGNVTIMQEMFRDSPLFNQDIDGWDVSKVTTTSLMFYVATSFNKPLNSWNVGSLVNANSMFGYATSFNQDISTWNISKITNLQNFLLKGKLSRANYDSLLLGWSTLDAGETLVPINLNVHFGNSKYSDTATVLTARNTTLIANKNWTITDDGMNPDAIVPYIISNTLAANNATISITFSENVYRTDVGSGALETTDFLFSLSGGTATLNTTVPSSISAFNNLTFVLGLDINGTLNGAEVLTVTPVLNSIFDVSGNAAATTQSNNTAQLNDLSNPIITGPSSATGLTSSISINENTAVVHTFSANETVNWSKGSTNDGGLFNIDGNGNLVFITAPDYETPSITLNSNTYVVDVIATDAANNATTQTLTITILDIPNSTFGTFATITKQYFTGTHTIVPPTTNNTNAIVYTIDNTAVATVSGSVITFTGVGTANITATQAADANYEGNAVSTLLTVLGKDLVSKYGGISSTNVNYISANGNVGGALGLDKYGKQEYVLDVIVSSGLVMHLNASNTVSYPGTGTNWTDLSGNGNHGTLQNGVAFTSVNNGAMVFDGVNDYFVTNNNLDLSNTDKLTIQIILKTASSNTQMIMEHSVNWNSNNAFGIISNNLSDKIQITDHNQGYNVSNSVASINDNNWHLFTATTDRSLNATDQNLIYIDDNAANKVNVTNLTNDNSGNFASHKLYLSSRGGTAHYFNGAIAQVLIYNRVLTAAEIQENFNVVKLKYGL